MQGRKLAVGAIAAVVVAIVIIVIATTGGHSSPREIVITQNDVSNRSQPMVHHHTRVPKTRPVSTKPHTSTVPVVQHACPAGHVLSVPTAAARAHGAVTNCAPTLAWLRTQHPCPAGKTLDAAIHCTGNPADCPNGTSMNSDGQCIALPSSPNNTPGEPLCSGAAPYYSYGECYSEPQ